MTILAVSTALQYFAAFQALRLISKTHRLMAWALISAAFLLMAIRRSISLWAIVVDQSFSASASAAEQVAFAISILMVLGLGRIGGYFDEIERAAEDRRMLHEKLLESQRLESLGLLSGGVAHDFNNILTCVLGNAEAARDQLGDGHPVSGALGGIIEAAERAANLTQHLLAYSGRGRFDVQHLDLTHEVVEIGKLVKGSVGTRCDLNLDLEEDLSPVEGDQAQIQQLVMNLILNAVESVGSETGEVRVVTRVVGAHDEGLVDAFADNGGGPVSDSYVRLSVIDDGCGMDEKTVSKIYDPFFSTKATGRGLGLSAVLGIVNGHRGAMRVSSAPGRGTRFDIWLPTVIPREATTSNETSSKAATSRAADLVGRTVLVVDDEESVRTTMRRLLEHQGFRVIEAGCGDEAVRLVADGQLEVDVAVVDLTMPGLDGRDTIVALRDKRPSFPAILISGFDERESPTPLLPDVLFLRKPFRQRELSAMIETVIMTREHRIT